MPSIAMIATFLLAASAGATVLTNEMSLLPPYADDAFPVEHRKEEAIRIAGELAKAKNAASQTDILIAKACDQIPTNAFERIRFEKRREVRSRTMAFAERHLARKDATGLGFAEQAAADLELMDRILREEAENLGKNPRYVRDSVVLKLSDFGAKGDGQTDDAPAFERAFAAVRKLGGKPSILMLGEGTFYIGTAGASPSYRNRFGNFEGENASRANLPVCNLENCFVEGAGENRTRILFGVYDKPGMVFVNCMNCALMKVECAYAQIPFLEGRVLNVSRDESKLSVDISLTPGSLRPDASSWDPTYTSGVESFGYEFDENGDMIQSARLLHWDSRNHNRCQELGNGNWRLFFRREFDPDNFDFHLSGIKVGGYLAIPNRCNVFPALRLMDCSHQLIEDVWVSNSRAAAIDAYWHSFMTSFHRFRVAPQTGFHQSTDADGCFCAPGTFLHDCSFEAMGDDGMNSLSNITKVRTTDGGLAVEREMDRGTNPIGSLVVFFDPVKGQYLANRHVAREPNGKITYLDKVVSSAVDGMVMIAPRFRGIGTIVSNCRWKNGRWSGAVIQTPDALIENCTFDNLHQEAVRMCFYGDWNEGLPPYNVLVRDCRITNCEKGVTSVYRHLGTDGKLVKPQASPMRAIEVVGCQFKNIPKGEVVLDYAESPGGNPIFEGWYADPQIRRYGSTYWVFPTYSHDYLEQTFIDVFSSPDLTTWTKHPKAVDTKDFTWVRGAMWAPDACEKDGRYYVFFAANDPYPVSGRREDGEPQTEADIGKYGGIGVAIADRPEGPYRDLIGKPLVDRFWNGAQPIDQYVFRYGEDWYMVYGGWGRCNLVKLAPDFKSLAPFPDGAMWRDLTPPSYTEGPVMFERKGIWYFMYSSGGWTDDSYCVKYCTATNPFGPFDYRGCVLSSQRPLATGAGHHSVLNLPGTDDWIICYHRRPIPSLSPHHRVTCIDRLSFDAEGKILPILMSANSFR